MTLEKNLLNKLRRQAKRGDAKRLHENLQALDPRWVQQAALAVAQAALMAGQLEAFRVALVPDYKVVEAPIGNAFEPTLVHVLASCFPAWESAAQAQVGRFLNALKQAYGGAFPPLEGLSSPLESVARRNQLGLAKALLAAGADPDGEYIWSKGPRSGHGYPPLHSVQSVEMLDVLLSAGASHTANGPATHLAGIVQLIVTWPRPEETAKVIECWMKHGGDVAKPLETDHPGDEKLSLLDVAFATAWDKKRFVGLWNWASMEGRIFALQETLVSRGWVDLDLDLEGYQGRPWAQWVQHHGSPRLQKKLALEGLEHPAPAKASRPRF